MIKINDMNIQKIKNTIKDKGNLKEGMLVYENIFGFGYIDSFLEDQKVQLKFNEDIFITNINDLRTTLNIKIRTFSKIKKLSKIYQKCFRLPFKEYSPFIKCEKSHPLTFMDYKFYTEKYKCEFCSECFYYYAGAWRCNQCKFDLCRDCYIKSYLKLKTKTKEELKNEKIDKMNLNIGDQKWKGALFASKSPSDLSLCKIFDYNKDIEVVKERFEFQLLQFILRNEGNKKFIINHTTKEETEKYILTIRKKTNAQIVIYSKRFKRECENNFKNFNNVFFSSDFESLKDIIYDTKNKLKIDFTTKEIENLFDNNDKELNEFFVTLKTDCTVNDLKESISNYYQINNENVILMYEGRLLDNDSAKLVDKHFDVKKSIMFVFENYPTFFRFHKRKENRNIKVSSDGLTINYVGKSKNEVVIGNKCFSKGLYYWEFDIKKKNNDKIFIGVCTEKVNLFENLGNDAFGYGYLPNQHILYNKVESSYGHRFKLREKTIFNIGVILDMNNRTLSYMNGGIRGNHLGIAFHNLPEKVFPAISLSSSSCEIKLKNLIKKQEKINVDLSSKEIFALPKGKKEKFLVSTSKKDTEKTGFFCGDQCFSFKDRKKVLVAGVVLLPERHKGELLVYYVPFDHERYALIAAENARKVMEIEQRSIIEMSAGERLQNLFIGMEMRELEK